jgi:hypothetical protein
MSVSPWYAELLERASRGHVGDLGGAVQVDLIEPRLKPPGAKHVETKW